MNIFILDDDFEINATYHVDSHVVKMPTEAAQMLCTVYRLKHGEKTDLYEQALDGSLIFKKDFYLVDSDNVEYKKGKLILLNKKIMAVAHIHHPCTIWAGESRANWLWLRAYATALNEEWKYRYNHVKDHLAITRIAHTPMPQFINKKLTPFVQAMPNDYKDSDAITAYRNYYYNAKQHLFKFKKRPYPEWLSDYSVT